MNIRTLFFPETRRRTDPQPERVSGVSLQEQAAGPQRPEIERTAAEALAERLAQAEAAATAALFVP